jgi:hypothetical protein
MLKSYSFSDWADALWILEREFTVDTKNRRDSFNDYTLDWARDVVAFFASIIKSAKVIKRNVKSVRTWGSALRIAWSQVRKTLSKVADADVFKASYTRTALQAIRRKVTKVITSEIAQWQSTFEVSEIHRQALSAPSFYRGRTSKSNRRTAYRNSADRAQSRSFCTGIPCHR